MRRTRPALALLLCVALGAGCDACEPDEPGGSNDEGTGPRDPGAADARSLVMGGSLACLVGRTGGVRCDGPDRPDVPGSLDDVAHLAMHGRRYCVARGDGTAACWERGGEPEDVAGIGDARAVAVGAEHACALREGGQVLCWGGNRRGQLGDGTTEARSDAEPVPGLSDVEQIAAGTAHTCALLGDGTVRCWGGNARSADVPREPRTAEEVVALVPRPVTEPRPVPAVEGVERIAAGADASCGVTSDRRVVCWPAYLGGEPRASALAWPGDAVQVAVGEWGRCAVREQGAVVCWDFAATDGRGRVVAPVAIRGVEDAVEVAVGAQGACARERSSPASCWTGPDHTTVLGSGEDSR